jgi:predicted ArsR family transcriptional regulator
MCEDMSQGKETVSDDEIIQIMQESDDPIHSAGEIANVVGVTRQCVFNRLQQLQAEGRVERKKSGSRTVVWWPSKS